MGSRRVTLNSPSGQIILEFSWKPLALGIAGILLKAILISALLSLGLILGVVAMLGKKISERVLRLGAAIETAKTVDALSTLPRDFAELDPIVSALQSSKAQLEASLSENIRLKTEAAVGQIASQVAHDIRSPLAALTVAEKDFASLPEDTRVMIRSAVGRIRDIANHLIEKNRAASNSGTSIHATTQQAVEEATVQLLPSIIEGIITEKRMQFRPKMGIEIDGRLDASSYGLFALIQPGEFKRVLSNLVNNSVEALAGS